MPSPDPNPFPDMSLPPRAEALPSWREEAAAYEAASTHAQYDAGAISANPATAPQAWRVGDIVLAPWEPHFLYVGQIAALEGREAHIVFGDGDEGWVDLEQIQAILFQPGQAVDSRRNMGPTFYPATVVQWRDTQLLLDFGGATEWVSHHGVRILCEPKGPFARPLRSDSPRPSPQTFGVGQRVWAPWMAYNVFVGTIHDIRFPEALIHFDDGDRGWVQLHQLFPFEMMHGMRVLARRGNSYDPATITQINGDRAFLLFDDGRSGWHNPASFALVCEATGPNARATVGSQLRTWLPTLGIVVGIVLLRGCLR